MPEPVPTPKQRLYSTAYAAAYAAYLPVLKSIAREHGYALAVHGSMATDLDLLACPWTESATTAEQLVEAIREAVNGTFDGASRAGPNPACRPHGRRAWSIYFSPDGGVPYLDISVMPREVEVVSGLED